MNFDLGMEFEITKNPRVVSSQPETYRVKVGGTGGFYLEATVELSDLLNLRRALDKVLPRT